MQASPHAAPPPDPGAHRPSANWSSTGDAKRRDRSSCASASTFTAKWLPWLKAATLGLDARSDHSTSGGSSDSELNELAVSPTRSPLASSVVMMVTPVANRPSAWRSVRVSVTGSSAIG